MEQNQSLPNSAQNVQGVQSKTNNISKVLENNSIPKVNSQNLEAQSIKQDTTQKQELRTNSNSKVNHPKKNMKPFIITMLILALFSGLGFLFWQSSNSKKLEDYSVALTEAQRFYQQHSYANALKSLNKAVAIYPTRSAAYEKTVDILLDKGQYSKAADVATAAESAMNNDAKSDVWGKIGLVYFEMKDYKNASKFLGQSISAEKESDYTYYYVMTLLNMNLLTDIDKYIDKTGNDSLVTNWNLYKSSMDNTSLNLFNRTEVVMRLINSGYPYLGINLYKDQDTAIEEYWEAQYYLGKAYYDIGENEKALPYLERALALGSQEVGLHLVTARVQYLLDMLDESIKSYDRAMAFASDDNQFEIMTEYMEMLLIEKLYVKAESELTRYKQPTETNWQYLEYMYLSKSGNREDAKSLAAKIDAQLLDSEWAYWYDYSILRISEYISDKEYESANKLIHEIELVDLYDAYVPYYTALIMVEEKEEGDIQELLDKAKDYDLTGDVSVLIETLESRLN